MTQYTTFRQRLDAVLRTLDIKQVQAFLVAEKQWSEGTPSDPEFAMWMMIAGSPTLRDLHERAYEWLVSHGHPEEASAVLGKSKKQDPRSAKSEKQHQRPRTGSTKKQGEPKR